MSDEKKIDLDVGKAFEEAFPDFVCMRCKNDSFILVSLLEKSLKELSKQQITKHNISSILDYKSLPTVGEISREIWEGMFFEVSCKRCGFTERYFAPMLLSATKPIVPGNNDD